VKAFLPPGARVVFIGINQRRSASITIKIARGKIQDTPAEATFTTNVPDEFFLRWIG